jgi:glycosyltransferase involved in cell wall biosynthesis
MNSTPLISVVLPVYNAEKYIGEAIRSILDQTYKNFELIVINDGSKDRSEEEIKKIQDPRIRYYSQSNAGMAATLNKGLSLAKGELIARQDADDISLPERFQRQVDFLQKHPDYALVGTWALIIDESGKPTGKKHKHPIQHEELKFDLLFDNMFVHSSVMFRKSVLDTCGVYDEKLHALVQDFEYWFRISRNYKIANLPEYLQLYRQISSGISSSTTDFAETVAAQSARHLATVWNAPENIIRQFASDYHTCNDENRVADAEKKFRELADKHLPSEFNGKEKLIARHLFQMKRNLYNRKLAESAGLGHFIYKLKRKLLFAKNREA